MDLWPAALAEDHVSGAAIGETLQAIISDKFRRLRDGDRFWFENDAYFVANADLLAEVRSTTLADIIRRNTSVGDERSDYAFVVAGTSETESSTETEANTETEPSEAPASNAAAGPAPAAVKYVPPLCFY